MASTKLLYPTCYMVPQMPQINIKSKIASHWSVLAIHPWTKNTKVVAFHTTRVAEQSPGVVVDDEEVNQAPTLSRTIEEIKEDLYQALQGLNGGIFGVPSAKKSQIHGLVKMLESQNPTPDPTLTLEKVGGCWKLVYSTITILGSKRTKLGLRDFISLGDFFQNIDVVQILNTSVSCGEEEQSVFLPTLGLSVTEIPPIYDAKMEGKAVNVIKFNVRGLNLLNGQLMIEASFKIASKSRVDIKYEKSTITPDQLMNVFRKNYHVLLGIFNPDGWLEITYVDGTLRIGRDDSGNIFILERSEEAKT